MSLYDFNYSMSVTFSAPVADHRFSLKCFPFDNARQKADKVSLEILPEAEAIASFDWTGNREAHGVILPPHSSFSVEVSGRCETYADIYEEKENALTHAYKYPTRLTAASEEMIKFYDGLGISEGEAPYDKTTKIIEAVHSYLKYEKGATSPATSAAEAFAFKKGVCQDFAHIAIALLRRAGVPAKYAAGICEGEGESHAWVEALCRGYWYGFDPTNDMLVTDGYIKFSEGRDAEDGALSRGIFKGFAYQSGEITASVKKAE